MGTEKLAWAEGFGGGEEAPLTGSRSMSMELRPLMADLASSDRRWRSSGGRFRGWVLGSNFGRRDDEAAPGSVEWRAAREGLEDFESA
jgi:hypothetical protein